MKRSIEMHMKRWTWTTLILLASATASLSQIDKTKLGAGIVVGGSKLAGDIETTNTGLTGGLMLTYQLSPRVYLSTTSTYGKMTSGLNAINTRVYNTSIVGNYFVLPNSPIKPFLSLGLSALHYETTDGDDAAILDPNGNHYRGWAQALQLGLGFQLNPSKLWTLNTVGNYSFSGEDDLDAITGGGNDGFFKGMVGLVRYFKNDGIRHADARMDDSFHEAKKALPVEQVQPIRKRQKPALGGGIKFVPGTTRLLDSSLPHLDKIYDFLVANPGEEIVLLGKSTRSKRSVNYALVVGRAQAIKSYLVKKGITSKRIIVNQRRK